MGVSGYSTLLLYCSGSHLEDVGGLEAVQAGLAQVVHHEAAADGGGIEAREAVDDLLPLHLFLDAGQHAEVFQIVHARDGDAGQRQGARQARPKADGRDHVFLVGVDVAGGATQPAFGSQLVRLTGVPDVHAAEVAARAVGVADAVDDSHVAVIPEPAQRGQFGVEADAVVQLEDALVRDSHHGPLFAVKRLSMGDYGVHVVVAAGKLQDHQNRIFLRRGHFACSCGYSRFTANVRCANHIRRTGNRAAKRSAAAFRRCAPQMRLRRSRWPRKRCRRPRRGSPIPAWCRRPLPAGP